MAALPVPPSGLVPAAIRPAMQRFYNYSRASCLPLARQWPPPPFQGWPDTPGRRRHRMTPLDSSCSLDICTSLGYTRPGVPPAPTCICTTTLQALISAPVTSLAAQRPEMASSLNQAHGRQPHAGPCYVGIPFFRLLCPSSKSYLIEVAPFSCPPRLSLIEAFQSFTRLFRLLLIFDTHSSSPSQRRRRRSSLIPPQKTP